LVLRPAVQDHKLPGEMVKSGPEIVDHVADEQAPLRIHRREAVHAQDVLASVTVHSAYEPIRVHREHAFDGLGECGEMGLRPLDLRVNAAKVRCHLAQSLIDEVWWP
jgi:hypothetical protein